MGGYIHNLYRENQRTVVRVTLEQDASADTAPLSFAPPATITAVNPPARQATTYSTVLDIPFIEWPAMSGDYGFDEVLELVFADPSKVECIRATIDGRIVPVYEYLYPMNRDMRSFYIELPGEVKSGIPSVLQLEIVWREAQTDTPRPSARKKGEAFVIGG